MCVENRELLKTRYAHFLHEKEKETESPRKTFSYTKPEITNENQVDVESNDRKTVAFASKSNYNLDDESQEENYNQNIRNNLNNLNNPINTNCNNPSKIENSIILNKEDFLTLNNENEDLKCLDNISEITNMNNNNTLLSAYNTNNIVNNQNCPNSNQNIPNSNQNIPNSNQNIPNAEPEENESLNNLDNPSNSKNKIKEVAIDFTKAKPRPTVSKTVDNQNNHNNKQEETKNTNNIHNKDNTTNITPDVVPQNAPEEKVNLYDNRQKLAKKMNSLEDKLNATMMTISVNESENDLDLQQNSELYSFKTYKKKTLSKKDITHTPNNQLSRLNGKSNKVEESKTNKNELDRVPIIDKLEKLDFDEIPKNEKTYYETNKEPIEFEIEDEKNEVAAILVPSDDKRLEKNKGPVKSKNILSKIPSPNSTKEPNPLKTSTQSKKTLPSHSNPNTNRLDKNPNNTSVSSAFSDLSLTTIKDKNNNNDFFQMQMRKQFTKRTPVVRSTTKIMNTSNFIEETPKPDEKKEHEDEGCRCDSKCKIF
jgi:hypothetical protein